MKIQIETEIVKAIFNTLQDIADEGRIKIYPKYIQINVQDEGNISLIDFIIKGKDIKYLQKSVVSFEIGVDYKILWKIFKELKGKELTLDIQEKKIIISDEGTDITYNTYIQEDLDKIKYFDVTKLKALEYPVEMSIKFGIFKKITTIAKIFSETILIKLSSKTGISFNTQGPKGNINHYRQSDLFNAVNNSETGKDVKTKEIYPIEWISKIIKMSKISSSFLIKSQEEKPASFVLSYGKESTCHYFVAPKIDGEEEEEEEEDEE